MRGHHPSRAVLVAALVAAPLTACTAAESAGPSDPPLSESSLIVGAYANPLDPVVFPDEVQQATIDAAVEAHIAACMTAHGFSQRPGLYVPRRRPAAEAQYTFFVTDPQTAATYGFAPPSWVEEAVSPRDDSPLPDGYVEALYGNTEATEVTDEAGTVIATYDPDSCAGRAWDAVTPHWAEQQRITDLAQGILLGVLDRWREAPSVLDATERWSACMAERGYAYATPADAQEDERWIDAGAPTAEEIPVAVAAAECYQSSGLLRAQSGVRARLTQHELDRHPGIVTRWLELQQETAERVTQQ